MKVQTLNRMAKPRVRTETSPARARFSELLIVSDDPNHLTPFKAGSADLCSQHDFQSLAGRKACRVLLLFEPDTATLEKISNLWPEKRPLVLIVSDKEQDVPGLDLVCFDTRQASKDSFHTMVRALIRDRNEKQAHDLLARVTHDMRSPMSVIKMACQFIKRKSEEEHTLRYIQMVEESSAGIQTLIGDILDYSKLNQGSVSLNVTLFDLPKLVKSVLDATRLLVKDKDVEVRADLCPNLPTTVSGDPGRLRQILGNLLGNAVKFTEKGWVELRVRMDSDTCYFQIADTGIGIAPGALNRIFQPYKQADSSILSRFGGTGLGLNICKFLIERMGGEIGVKSRLGEGSQFHFHIKLSPVERERKALESIPWDRLQVWLVGGSCSQPWKKQYEELDLNLQAFSSTHELTERARLGNPDLLIFHLERGGFVELDRILKCFPKKLPRVIVTTALGQRGDGARCKALGVNGYLSTPFSFEELKSATELVLQAEPGELVTKHMLKEQG